MWGRKTEEIKRLEAEVERYQGDYEASESRMLALQNTPRFRLEYNTITGEYVAVSEVFRWDRWSTVDRQTKKSWKKAQTQICLWAMDDAEDALIEKAWVTGD